ALRGMRAQPFLALGGRHAFPVLAELLALFVRHRAGRLVDGARALALLRIHLLETAHAVAGAFAPVGRQFLPALGAFEHARPFLRLRIPAVAQRRDEQFALLGAELLPAWQFGL